MKKTIALLLFVAPAFGQEDADRARGRYIEFPDVPGYVTLKCDLHSHSVFSDGSVWPDIRVEEAIRDGLDALSLTEHLEYQPHLEDIPHEDRNRSYVLAQEFASGKELMIVHGTEITRDMPPGHSNAIFIRDANAILAHDYRDAFREARRQGAFVFWNHPNWTGQAPDGIARLSDVHRELIEEGLLHGIEIVNETTVSEEALQIALDRGLTLLGTSDVHGLVDWDFGVPEGGHRPITLVLATERSIDGIREALFAGRTVVWFGNDLIGRPEFLNPLLEASIVVTQAWHLEESTVAAVAIENRSEVTFVLQNLGKLTLQDHGTLVELAPHATTEVQVRSGDQRQFELELRVLNALTAPRAHPVVRLPVTVR